MGIFDPIFGKNQGAISGLGAGLLSYSQPGRRRNIAQEILWGLKQGLSIEEAKKKAERQVKLDEMSEKKYGMDMYAINNNINRQARQDERQAATDKRINEAQAAFKNYAQSYNPESNLYQTPGILAGAGKDQINQFRVEQGLLGGVSPKTFAETEKKQPTSIQEYLYSQQNPEFLDFMKSKKPKMFLDPLDKPLSATEITNGYVFPKGVNPPAGATVREIRKIGGQLRSKPVAAESAFKQAMIDTALDQSKILNDVLYNDKGEIDQSVVKGMAVKSMTPNFLQPLTYGVSTKGQQAAAAMETMIQGQTRGETGAAMPSSELGNSRKRFQPFPWDDEIVQKQKLLAMDLFLNNSKKYFDPNIDKRNMTPERAARLTNAAITRALSEAASITSTSQKPKILGRPPLSSFVSP